MDDASLEQLAVPLDSLLEITDGFSETQKLGSGSFGEVYLGVHQGQRIAVKRFYDMTGVDDKQFQNEFRNLTRLRHRNIVRLVGYCYDVQEVQVKHQGRMVLAEKIHRMLCLEYMPNGSLENYISDECDKYNWHTGYGIIKGICHGLNYLHNDLKPPIYHLDLKPANVLLDENMVPRIADFGISRLFGDERTRATKSSLGTVGYLPPEYILNNLISNKFDVFSLGVVIIKIMAGRSGYFNIADMSSQEFVNLVQEKWTNRLHETSDLTKASSKQVKICIEIGLSCVQEDRHKRPTIQDIVDRLNETEAECAHAARKNRLLIKDSLRDRTQRGSKYSPNNQQATLSTNDISSSYDTLKANFRKLSAPKKFDERENSCSLTADYFMNNGHRVRPLNNYAGPSTEARTAWKYTTDMTAEPEFGEGNSYQHQWFSRVKALSNNDAGLSKKETLPFSQYPYEHNLHQGLYQHDPSMPHYGTSYNRTHKNVLNAEGSRSAQRTIPFHDILPVSEDDGITGASLTGQKNEYVPLWANNALGTPFLIEDGIDQGISSAVTEYIRSTERAIRRLPEWPRIEDSYVANQAFIRTSNAQLPKSNSRFDG